MVSHELDSPMTLAEFAKAKGLIDPDLVKLALPGVTPELAVADLRHRYPRAFRDARTMTPAEREQSLAKLLAPQPRPPLPDNLRKHMSEMTLSEIEAFERHYGIVPNAGERHRRRQTRRAVS